MAKAKKRPRDKKKRKRKRAVKGIFSGSAFPVKMW